MNGKIAVVTGASRGLGTSMATHMAAQSVVVIGTYRHSRGQAEELVAEIEYVSYPNGRLHQESAATGS